MRRPIRRPDSEGAFSISLLDAIACAFGAIILLVLVTPNNADEVRELADRTVRAAEEAQERVRETNVQADAQRRAQMAEIRELRKQAAKARGETRRLLAHAGEQDSLRSRAEAMQEALRKGRALLAVEAPDKGGAPIPEAAGIPVDADHVAIVLDTSGSMRPRWSEVMHEMSNVLGQYPQLNGFQVLSDQGEYLLPHSAGRWMRDSAENRRAALRRMRTWTAYSASNPTVGILRAVRDLHAPSIRMAIFVFGDDYQGTEFESVLSQVERGVRAHGAADSLRIHAIGFSNTDYAIHAEAFAALMRAMTHRHGGAFVALPEQSASNRIVIRRGSGPLKSPID